MFAAVNFLKTEINQTFLKIGPLVVYQQFIVNQRTVYFAAFHYNRVISAGIELALNLYICF